ncbi:MAG TPA: hypothetical protein VFA65_07480 [Bryobacteraceae bacterium]|nr:hypothetical protein [Bryobacteraceae bacterium]
MLVRSWKKLAIRFLKELSWILASVVVVLVSLAVYKHISSPNHASHDDFPSNATPSLARQVIGVGRSIKVAAIDFRKYPFSLILFAQPRCGYCIRSEPFHRTVSVEAAKNKVAFIVAVPSRKKAQQYLNDINMSSYITAEWKDLSLSVDGTPTIIAVDSNGVVRRIWIGQLSPTKEKEIINLIVKHDALDAAVKEKSRGGIDNYPILAAYGEERQIIDVSERAKTEPRQGVINIPLYELPIRASYELDHRRLQVVDCANVSLKACSASTDILAKAGYRTAAVGAGEYYQSCGMTALRERTQER